ncbi:MAG: hypothetical protein ACREV3_09880, partial [Gammaproteobacteria bacterium]
NIIPAPSDGPRDYLAYLGAEKVRIRCVTGWILRFTQSSWIALGATSVKTRPADAIPASGQAYI